MPVFVMNVSFYAISEGKIDIKLEFGYMKKLKVCLSSFVSDFWCLVARTAKVVQRLCILRCCDSPLCEVK